MVESSCSVVSAEDLLDDLPVDLLSPVWLLPDFVVEEAALLVPAGLLPALLASARGPGSVVSSELDVESVCAPVEVPDEAELLVCDCDCVLVEAWGAGAGDWEFVVSAGESPPSSAAKLSALVEAEGSAPIDFGCTLNGALSAASNVTLTTARLSQ